MSALVAVEYVVDITAPVISTVEVADGSYGENSNLDVSVHLSEAVHVTGTPQMTLTIGTATKYASYIEGTGSSTLIFRYGVLSDDRDSNGIGITSPLDLASGGAIKDVAGNDITTPGLALTPPSNLGGVLVNGALKAGHLNISSITLAPGHYSAGSVLEMSVVFSGDVRVAGVPQMALDIGGGASKYAEYVGGTGASKLIFRYTIGSNDNDSNGIEITSPLELRGGTLSDGQGDAVALSFRPLHLSDVIVDTTAPGVFRVSVDDGSYGKDSHLDVRVVFSEEITVDTKSGIPQIALSIGGSPKYARYTEKKDPKTLIFRYGVEAQVNGVLVMTTPLELNGGSLKDTAGNASTLRFTLPELSGVVVETVPPAITSVSVASGSYGHTTHLDVKVKFSEVVNVKGNPRIALDIGAPKYAIYIEGKGTQTLTFRYVVDPGDRDGDGIGMTSPLDLHGGAIQDTAGNLIESRGLSFTLPENLNEITVNGALVSNHLRITGVTLGDGTYGVGSHLDVSVTFSGAVTFTGTPRMALNIGVAGKYASYTAKTNASTATFRYTVVGGDHDTDGIAMTSPIDLSGGRINDSNGDATSLDFRPPDLSGVIVDTTAPTISSVTVQNGAYGNSSLLDVRVEFSEDVVVNRVNGTPRIALDIGGAAGKYAEYVDGTGTSRLIFRYTVVGTDGDSDGIGMTSSLDLNNGSIADRAQNAITALAFTLPSNLGDVTVDGNTTSISGVSVPTGRYKEGDALNIAVVFSEAVTVTTAIPRMALEIGGERKYADYVDGSGHSTLNFRYTVQAQVNGGVVMTPPLDLHGAAITDSDGSSFSLNFSSPANLSEVVVDTTAPRATVGNVANGSYSTGENLDVIVTFNEAVNVTGGPRITLYIGGSAAAHVRTAGYEGGSGSKFLTFRYTVASGESDTDGIGMSSPLLLNSGTIKDLAGNDIEVAGLAFTLPTSLNNVLVDTTAPTIASNVRVTDGSYSTGENLDVIVTFSENVLVEREPRIALQIGGSGAQYLRYATYSGGENTRTLTFRYTVASGDNDTNGIGVSSPLQLNSGTIKDRAGNDIEGAGAALVPAGPDVLSAVLVDTTAPTILRITAPAKSHGENSHLYVSVEFREVVLVSGSPQIALTIGTDRKNAEYQGGSDSQTLIFRYVVEDGFNDSNGIVVTPPLALNSGTIKDSAGNDIAQAGLSFTAVTLDSVLVDTTAPTISGVTVASGSYKEGSTLDVTVNLSEKVTVNTSGTTPRIELNIGGTTQYATYHNGTDTLSLLFRYVIQTGLNDPDGIGMSSSLDLNNATIKDSAGNDLSGLSLPSVSGLNTVLVDTTAPRITGVSVASGSYKKDSTLDVTVNLSELVNVTGGTPRLALTIGATERQAVYFSGDGSSALIFRYRVVDGDNDSDGIGMAASLNLNSATIKDSAGNDLSGLSLPSVSGLNTVLVDTTAPRITGVSVANGSYKEGSTLDVTVNLSELVNVTGGTPRLALTIGETERQAVYLSGDGSAVLTFRYTVVSGENDSDGIGMASSLDLNSGVIKDSFGNDIKTAGLAFTVPDLSGVIVDTTAPTIASVSVASGSYKEGSTLDVTVNLSELVNVTGGTPRLALTIGETERQAVYFSGDGSSVLTFRYTVVSGENDNDGIGMNSSLDLNSAMIKDSAENDIEVAGLAFTVPGLTAVIVDTTAPRMTSVAVTNGSYGASSPLNVVVSLSEDVLVTNFPRIALTIGEAPKYAVYQQGSGSQTLTFRYVVDAGLNDPNGIDVNSPLELNNGTIRDGAGNDLSILAFTPPSNVGNVIIDSTALAISSVSVVDGYYRAGAHLDATVTFNRDVTVEGVPQIALMIGVTSRVVSYHSRHNTSTLIFRYTIKNSDTQGNGMAMSSPLELNSGHLRDDSASDINAAGLIFTPPSLSGVYVDTTAASISSVSVVAKTYGQSANLDVSVTFNEAVEVVGGPPKIALDIGGTVKDATYLSGTGSSTLLFRYVVQAGLNDSNGIGMTSALDLAGGTIKDIAGNDLSGLTFTLPSLSAVFVDAIAPTIASVSVVAKTYGQNANLDVSVTFSEAVEVVGGPPKMTLDIGGTSKDATYLSGTGNSTLLFRYVVQAGLNDSNGIEMTSPLDLAGGTIKDTAGNNLSGLTFTPPSLPAVIVETTAPTISGVTVASGSHRAGSNLDVIVTFSEAVNVTQTPRIALDIGGTPKYAIYNGGTGSSALTFRYTVVDGDNDSDGIGMTSSLQLNNGTIKDVVGNDLSTFTFQLPSHLDDVLVDTTAPTILSASVPRGSYGLGDDLDVIVTFSEPVVKRGTLHMYLSIDGVTDKVTYYQEGSGTSRLTFRRRIEAGWNDTNGIGLRSPLYSDIIGSQGALGQGLSDIAGNYAIHDFTPPSLSTVLVDTTPPRITGVSVASGSYGKTSRLDVTLTFDEAVRVFGTPQMALNIGGSTQYASYYGGTKSSVLTFRYTVAGTDSDSNGIGMDSSLDMNGGMIRDTAGNAMNVFAFTPPSHLGEVVVDGTSVGVSSVLMTAKRYKENDAINIAVNFSDAVTVSATPRIALSIGGQTKYASYLSGGGGSTLNFVYTVGSGDNDSDGIGMTSPIDLNGGSLNNSIGDAVGLIFAPPIASELSGVIVDTTAPTILSVTVVRGNYGNTSHLDVSVHLSEPVRVTEVPRIALTIGGSTKYASYYGGTESSLLTFRYKIAAADSGSPTMTPSLDLNHTGVISDIAGNVMSGLAFTSPTSDLSAIVIDGSALGISSVEIPAGGYSTGDSIDVRVTFSDNVEVSGTPRIILNIEGQTRYALYSAGGGTSILTFRCTVVSGENDSDGIGMASSIDLNGGSLNDSSGSAVGLILTPPIASELSGVIVDTMAPRILSAVVSDGSYGESSILDVIVNLSEAVVVTQTPRIALNIGGGTKYATYHEGTESSILTFRYTIEANLDDSDGIGMTSPIELLGEEYNKGLCGKCRREELYTFRHKCLGKRIRGYDAPRDFGCCR